MSAWSAYLRASGVPVDKYAELFGCDPDSDEFVEKLAQLADLVLERTPGLARRGVNQLKSFRQELRGGVQQALLEADTRGDGPEPKHPWRQATGGKASDALAAAREIREEKQ